MTTTLRLYNAALRARGVSNTLVALTDDRPERYALDEAYTDVLARALEEGLWNFAQRSVEVPYEPSVEVDFGFQYAFEKPDDWVRKIAISGEETFTFPLEDYLDEGDYWYANVQSLFVTYVSNGATYGGDLARWPQTFADAVALMLALDIGPGFGALSEGDLRQLEKRTQDAIRNARSKDAMNQPIRRRPPGSLVRARRSSWYGGTDRR